MTDFADMKTAVSDVLERGDMTDAQNGTFILDTLTRIHRKIRIPTMERVSELTIDSVDQIDIPSDYLELIHMIYNGPSGPVKLQRLELGDFYKRPTTGTTAYYTRVDDKWEFRGSGVGDTCHVYYYGDPTPIVEDTDTDLIFSVAPDLVKFGALSYAADVFQDERGPQWEQRFQQLLMEVEEHSITMEAREGYRAVNPGTDLEY